MLGGAVEAEDVPVRASTTFCQRGQPEPVDTSVDAAEHRRLLSAFVAAARTGDVASLEALLTPDVVSLSDGDGIRGRARVAGLSAYRQFWREAEPDTVPDGV
ncbi:hypothetical protein [Streptomyces sp. NBC_01622]|uniref:hypothetical protein n=1 Tax=Streptomyces sp. NBC_01622 TaxID=2975903 RepID=UPI00386D696C